MCIQMNGLSLLLHPLPYTVPLNEKCLLDVRLNNGVQVSPQLLLRGCGVVLYHTFERCQHGNAAGVGATHQSLGILQAKLEYAGGRMVAGGGAQTRYRNLAQYLCETHSFRRLIIRAFLSCWGRWAKCCTCFSPGTACDWKAIPPNATPP